MKQSAACFISKQDRREARPKRIKKAIAIHTEQGTRNKELETTNILGMPKKIFRNINKRCTFALRLKEPINSFVTGSI